MGSQNYPANGAGYYKLPQAAGKSSGGASAVAVLGFNASNYNPIYGNSTTVTPDSCSVKFFIRY